MVAFLYNAGIFCADTQFVHFRSKFPDIFDIDRKWNKTILVSQSKVNKKPDR